MFFYQWKCRIPFDFFADGLSVGQPYPAVIFPADWVEAKLTRLGPISIEVQELPNRYDRVWLVLCLGKVRNESPVTAPLAAAYGSVTDQSFQGVSISLFADPVRQSGSGTSGNHF